MNRMTGSTGLSPVVVKRNAEGTTHLILSGFISIDVLRKAIDIADRAFNNPAPSKIVVELKSLENVDSSGALFLLYLEQKAQSNSIPFEFLDMAPQVANVISLLGKHALVTPPASELRSSFGFFETVGHGSIMFFDDIIRSITFSGILLLELMAAFFHPKSVRWKDVLSYMRRAGVDGLPIVGLISFLLGLIIAFMSSLQLKQFGANMYVASLVAIAMVRELGPIITAILVTGRSGSAFAAEIGTMKVNEEVDALVTMGFNPIRFLAIPKVMAAVVVVPILTLFSDLFAITGGLVVGVLGLDLTIRTYADLTSWALTISDVIISMVKSAVFAILIAGIGCERGFRVSGGAEAVGKATTSAVVSGLFLIIVTDSVFAIAMNYIQW
jgi:phospholipid/cholesterol/gamma-HCH transport system permease protein